VNKPKLLVIDDELESRKRYYDRILSEKFDLTYVGVESDLRPDLYKESNLLVIDLRLDGWLSSPMEKILEDAYRVNEGIPIVIVSKHWMDNGGQPIAEMLRYKRKFNVLLFLSWNQIAFALNNKSQLDLVVDSWRNWINTEFALYQERFPTLLKPNEPIRLVQIADMQFGGATEPGTIGDNSVLAEHFKSSMRIPTFSVICGDIVQSGKKSEFCLAYDWIEGFKKTLSPDSRGKTWFLASPGNHDCDFEAFLPYVYQANFPKKHDTEKKVLFDKRPPPCGKELWDNPDEKNSIKEVAFANYIQFADELHKSYRSIHKVSYLSVVNDFFLNWGIRIIHLDTLNDISPDNIRGVGINTKTMEDIIGHCTRTETTGVFTVLISHYGPYDLGYKDEEDDKRWKDIERFLSGTRVNLWLCGHRHKFDIDTITIGFSKSEKIIPYAHSGSLRINRESMDPSAQIGVNEIELIRENSIVSNIKITPVSMQEHEPKRFDTKEFSVEL
jgi:hypothetical protein